MDAQHRIRELTAEDVDLQFDPQWLGFATTEELPPLDGMVGQPRALRALDLGLGIHDGGYNVYVSGTSGMGLQQELRRVLEKRASEQPKSDDWVYVNNFDHPDHPIALSLKAGHGNTLRRDIEQLVQRLRDEVPKAFRQEDFSREKQRINHQYESKLRDLFRELEQFADQQSLIVQQTPDGNLLMVPKKDDRPMRPEEFDKLSQEEKDEVAAKQQELGQKARSVFARQRDIRRQLRTGVQNVEYEFASRLIGPAVDEIVAKYQDNERLSQWLAKLKANMTENLDRFQDKGGEQQNPLSALMGGSGQRPEEGFSDYEVNVVVDNSTTEGAPLIMENSPNYKNLFGTIHGTMDRAGRLTTNFTHIGAGSLLRANGGYLVFDLLEALIEPLVWKELKRTIRSGLLEYHMYDPFGVFVTSSLKPEPIPLRLKLVVTGTPLIYYLLHLYDEDFREIFKVKADFSTEIDLENDTGKALGQLVKKMSIDDNVMPLEREAVVELVRAAARLAGDKSKLSGELARLGDLVREATYWARQDGAVAVGKGHIRQAIDERVFRSDLIAAKIRELIGNGTLLITLDGKAVGQVNGVSVIQLGDYMFGRPSRVTASVGIGTSGIVNIERESKLSGSSFDKAMLILEGYVRNRYAAHHPVALSAGIAMEQSYGMIEGDSASVAELVCLLSAIGCIPLRQDIAVTGSVNQWGQVQAVGAVSEKVEGFFDVCAQKELTGRQGVCIPEANIKNMLLRPDVVEAVRQGRFHVWTVSHVDQVLELLCGIRAGDIDKEQTGHWYVDQRLREMADMLRDHKGAVHEKPTPALAGATPSRDPRPPLPGRE